MDASKRLEMLGLVFDRVTMAEAVQQLIESAELRRTELVVTPNIDQVVRFEKDVAMHEVYRSAQHVYADGMPIIWLSRWLAADGGGLPERVTGADLVPAVCMAAASTQLGVYFMGGDDGVAEAAANAMERACPGLKISGVSCPPRGFENDRATSERLVEEVNASGAHILFLGVGAPKQEKWGCRYQTQLNVGPILCVGAAFSFAAGIVRRAPKALQDCGLEWAWRLAQEPRRLWRRYLVQDMKFVRLAAKELARARGRGP